MLYNFIPNQVYTTTAEYQMVKYHYHSHDINRSKFNTDRKVEMMQIVESEDF